MSWNDQNRPNDPWGNKSGQQPPDLDEIVKQWQDKLNKLFGQGKKGGGADSGNTNGGGSGFSALILVGILVVWGAMGFYTVDQQQRGVVLRFGEALETQVQPGLRWNPPLIDKVLLENVTKVRSHDHSALMLTEDENIVRANVSVQWNIFDLKKFLLQVKNPEESLAQATESALRHVVGSTLMDQVLTEGREQIAVDVQLRLQRYLDNYGTGISIKKVNIDDTQPPEEVKEAFDDVIKAKEDEQRTRNEAESYANRIIPEARGYASRQIEEANAYKAQVVAEAKGDVARFQKLLVEYTKAPKVTRDRLYLDAIQEVLSNSTKIMMDQEGSNALLYLPLEKLVSQTIQSNQKADAIGSNEIGRLTDQVVNELRERQRSSRPSRSAR